MIKSAAEVPGFAEKIIEWQHQHGRHDLPWQNTRDAYAVWVSEIMLQQTQVSTVIPYYQRFMQRFPDIASLAQAEQESVLQYWSGLGYYSRARNLHAAAQQIMSQQGGAFPQSLDQAVSLPGIGRSTAAAILCFAFGQQHAILDGNVKRVLTRCYGIAGWPGKPSIEKQLWQLAASVLPKRDNESYIQGLMDLGASVCTRSKPACSRCPLQHDCVAKREQRVAFLPSAKPRKLLPEKNTVMLLLWNGSEILLQKRPPIGIWGGMWSLPELNSQNNLLQQIQAQLGLQAEMVKQLPLLRHSFTHFRLHITPLLMRVTKRSLHLQQDSLAWRSIDDALDGPIPSPIRKLIMEIAA